jgi:hypothetical protein
MTSSTENPQVHQQIFPANVVKVINNYKLAINRGSEQGIRVGQRILVYCLSDEEITDPNTGESLGYLEIVKGTGKVIHIQEKMSTIESDRKKIESTKFNKSLYGASLFPSEQQVVESESLLPFDEPEVGDIVKPI